ncbi:MAG: NUDIX domain-containing protein [Rhodobacteraceae bacterium]|nr:NUDIX domain-containing protein [Paracoccaceae bacterium]
MSTLAPSALALAPDDLDNSLFFYGTLRDLDLLALVTGRESLAGVRLTPAKARGFRVERVAGESFPMAFGDTLPEAAAVGLLVAGLNTEERERIAFFEDGDYALSPVMVETLDSPPRQVAAAMFQPTQRLRESGEPWDLDAWVKHDKALALACARRQLRYFGEVAQPLVETWWPDIKVAAERELGSPGVAVNSGMTRDDVQELARREPYQAFFRVTEMEVSHRGFRGGVSAPVERAAFRIGPVTTVLPYDPCRDEVVLIEQWRAGPWVNNDLRPWSLEIIAGRIEPGENPEATARREAVEEAGAHLRRLEEIGRFYASPGATDEYIHAYAAEADLTEVDGVHGLAAEHEDIRVVKLSYWKAMEALARGELTAAPAALSLLWLARHRDRLRVDWRQV